MEVLAGARYHRKSTISPYPLERNRILSNRSGFSLMELMIAFAILAILAAIAIPNAIAWRNNSQFSAAVRQVKSTIDGTRMAAIRTNMPADVFFNGTPIFTTQTRSVVAGAAVLNPLVPHQLPAGVTVNSNNGGQLTFNNRGLATNCTVTVQHANGLNNNIVVAITGSSRIQ